jgi:hypothetical protein
MVLSESEEPRWMKSKTASDDPKRVMPNTDKELPSLMNERKDRDAPTCTKSSTDKEEPRRVMPKTDKELPKR